MTLAPMTVPSPMIVSASMPRAPRSPRHAPVPTTRRIAAIGADHRLPRNAQSPATGCTAAVGATAGRARGVATR